MITYKKYLSAILLITVLAIGCTGKERDMTRVTVDKLKKSISFTAIVNGKYFFDPTRHAVIYKDGKFGNKSIFKSLASHLDCYKALITIGAKPGQNMTMENKSKTKVKGDALKITLTWKGAKRTYTLDEVVTDSNGRKIQIRFGGNFDRSKNINTGCIICLDSCPVGISSNAAYTYGAVENRQEVTFKGNKDILPKDGTPVTITMSL